MYKFILAIMVVVYSSVGIADEKVVTKQLEESFPGTKIDSIKNIADTGLYEVIINGQILYVTADGQYVIQGDMLNVATKTNVTEQRRVALRKAVIDGLDEKDMIIFEPKETKYTVTVFTDIDCGYCRKMHEQMAQYNDLGIRFRYLSFPRGGIDSKSYDDAVSVWCAEDRNTAITEAKRGVQVAELTCNNPVRTEFELGKQLGVQGTPSIFMESGQMLPGYVPPAELQRILEEASKQS